MLSRLSTIARASARPASRILRSQQQSPSGRRFLSQYKRDPSSHHEADPFHNLHIKLVGGAFVVGGGYLLIKHKPQTHGESLPQELPEQPASTEAKETSESAPTTPEPSSESTAESTAEVTSESEQPAAPRPKPKSLKPEPLYYPYVLIGSGTAAFSAANAIRDKDPYAQILMIAQEDLLPYNRTPLSKELWHTEDPKVSENLIYKQWNGKHRSIFYETPDFFVDALSPEAQEERSKVKEVVEKRKRGELGEEKVPNHVKIIKGHPAVSLDVDTQLVTLANGQKIYFEKLLLATGGTPRQLPIFKKLPDEAKQFVSTYRSLDDFRKLEELTAQGNKHVVVIGGGFLGSELSCALAHRAQTVPGMKVSQIYPEDGNMGLAFPRYLSDWTTNKLRQEGINILNKNIVTSVTPRENGLTLHLRDETQLEADHVVLAVGIVPNVQLGRKAGLELDSQKGGIVVNSELEARRNIFVAGDASSYYDIALRRRRVEHYEHAVVSGRIAGENMVGARKPYKHQPMFWSDLGPKIGYEAIGLIDSSLVTVGVWAKATAKDTPQEATNTQNIRSAEVGEISDSSEAKQVEETVPEVAAPAPLNSAADEDKYGKGVIYYLKDKKVVGILTWNLFNKMSTAREIIKSGKTFEDFSELTKLIKVDPKDH